MRCGVVSDVNEGTLSPVGLFFGSIFGLKNFRPRSEAIVAVQPLDMVLCVDASGTMSHVMSSDAIPSGGTSDVPSAGSRWYALLAALNPFFTAVKQQNPTINVGLVVFGGMGPAGSAKNTSLPPAVVAQTFVDSTKYSRITSTLSSAGKLGLQGSTDITAGLRTAVDLLKTKGRSGAKTLIVLMSDGDQNTPRYTTAAPEVAAGEAAAFGATVHTMLIGPDDAEPRMRAIASIGGGEYIGRAAQ